VSQVTLPPPREPAIDPNTNTFSRNWIRYFQQVFERIGGAVSDTISLANFTGENQSLAPTGYQAFPGGYVELWGITTLGPDASVDITFDPAFGTACTSFICEETGATEASGIVFSHSTPTLNGVTVYGSGKGTTNAVKTFHWRATGYTK
jgi:hypothetical protein